MIQATTSLSALINSLGEAAHNLGEQRGALIAHKKSAKRLNWHSAKALWPDL